MIWDDTVITSLAGEAEEICSMELACIVERLSLTVTSGQSLISLPSYTTDIVSVTWKGKMLDPYPMESYMEAGSGPSTISSSTPRYYLYSGYGHKTLKLLPAPNESLNAAIIPLVTKSEIAKRFVVEIKRLPDLTGTSFRLPTYFSRPLIKEYVCYKAFLQEGNGQNLKASKYYKFKFKAVLGLTREIYNGIFISKRYEMLPQQELFSRGKPGRPVLPSQFGQVVE